MKKLLAVCCVVGLSACAGYQAKLENAMEKARDVKAKVDCRAKILNPYVDLILAQDLPAYLEGASIDAVLDTAEVVMPEFEKIKAEFKACAAAE